MWADKLLDAIVERGYSNGWPDRFKEGFEQLFGQSGGRYPESARKTVIARAPATPESDEKFVSFAALIHPSNPGSGAYGGTSLAVFPGEDAPCLISLVVGTNGLAPDEQILGRPGHARKAAAICAWLNAKERHLVAWSKYDPTRLDQRVPAEIAKQFDRYSKAIARYGHVLYAMYAPGSDQNLTLDALTAFLDLLFEERGVRPLASYKLESDAIRASWYRHLMPQLLEQDVVQLLNERRYVILQGPPGKVRRTPRASLSGKNTRAEERPFNSTQTPPTKTSSVG